MLQSFAPDDFDFIVIDEAHRAGAHSYQKIMAYFQPEFYLGMSASPERSDAFDIYKLFDHNIAYEIRLQQALEEDLLCPFHYFGITDIAVQEANETVAAAGVADDAEEDTAGEIFSRLTIICEVIASSLMPFRQLYLMWANEAISILFDEKHAAWLCAYKDTTTSICFQWVPCYLHV